MPDKPVRKGVLVSPCEYETSIPQQWRYTLYRPPARYRPRPRSPTRRQRPLTGTVGNGAGGSQRLASSGLLAIVLDGGEDCLR
jgi:hypothetical protein